MKSHFYSWTESCLILPSPGLQGWGWGYVFSGGGASIAGGGSRAGTCLWEPSINSFTSCIVNFGASKFYIYEEYDHNYYFICIWFIIYLWNAIFICYFFYMITFPVLTIVFYHCHWMGMLLNALSDHLKKRRIMSNL